MSTNTASPRATSRHAYYIGVGVLSAAILFWGFAKSYYLKFLFATPKLPLLFHIHGALMTTWIVLFFTQTVLVASHRVSWHRRMGIFAVALTVAIVIVGTKMALIGVGRGATFDPNFISPLGFLAYTLGHLVLFAGFVSAALLLRGRPDVHKRLMVLAWVSILMPGIARIPLAWVQNASGWKLIGLNELCLAACILFDTIKNRKLHPAFLWGGALLAASMPALILLGRTAAWQHVAARLVR
jgi:hypothetical protein